MLTKEIKEIFGKRKSETKVVKQSADIDVKDPRFYDKEGNLSPSRVLHYTGIDAMEELGKGIKING